MRRPPNGRPALVLRILERAPAYIVDTPSTAGSASRNLGWLQAVDPAAATALAVRELAGSPATVGIGRARARFNAPLTLLDELNSRGRIAS